VALAAREGGAARAPREALEAAMQELEGARPTAVNLHWAVERMRRHLADLPAGSLGTEAAAEAERIHREDVAANKHLGDLGAALIEPGRHVVTHCNTGALATGGYGTALGVIRSAYAQGRIEGVFAGETRPWLQGARLTAWELYHEDIPVRLIADGAAAALMRGGEIGWVVVGADRIAANGDVANKIGTYALAIAARAHGVGFMVAAPLSTVDWATARGDDIPIETRAESELLSYGDVPVAQAGVGAWNPVFDVTPASLIDAIVTEAGVVRDPNGERMQSLRQSAP
ncbi:S-methyl-5-thioribose-1-phosphate isomerase, partial [Ectothiorhodospiraceae bacterium WFHF3C12]|nr:S-methyl-5-thioribose-1-phosphate isomerase [Ectothiorhodospiraceae bacterium WFHF3C12]